MRADEPITWIEVETQSSFSNRNYINQLRYERLMAKARCFEEISKNPLYIPKLNQAYRIAEAYEERAKRIKEVM